MSYCQLKFEIQRHENCREGCWNYTEWSTVRTVNWECSIKALLIILFCLLQCTQTCGTGTQVREVRCYLNQNQVSDELCNRHTKSEYKELIRTCNMEPCRYYPDVTVSLRLNCRFQFNKGFIHVGKHALHQPLVSR